MSPYASTRKFAGELLDATVRFKMVRLLEEAFEYCVEEEEGHIRYFIVKTIISLLGVIGNREAAEVLGKALEDRDYRVRMDATEALATFGEPALIVLMGALTNRDSLVRSRVADYLGNIGNSKALLPLKKAYENEEDPLAIYSIKRALDKLQGSHSVASGSSPAAQEREAYSVRRAGQKEAEDLVSSPAKLSIVSPESRVEPSSDATVAGSSPLKLRATIFTFVTLLTLFISSFIAIPAQAQGRDSKDRNPVRYVEAMDLPTAEEFAVRKEKERAWETVPQKRASLAWRERLLLGSALLAGGYFVNEKLLDHRPDMRHIGYANIVQSAALSLLGPNPYYNRLDNTLVGGVIGLGTLISEDWTVQTSDEPGLGVLASLLNEMNISALINIAYENRHPFSKTEYGFGPFLFTFEEPREGGRIDYHPALMPVEAGYFIFALVKGDRPSWEEIKRTFVLSTTKEGIGSRGALGLIRLSRQLSSNDSRSNRAHELSHILQWRKHRFLGWAWQQSLFGSRDLPGIVPYHFKSLASLASYLRFDRAIGQALDISCLSSLPAYARYLQNGKGHDAILYEHMPELWEYSFRWLNSEQYEPPFDDYGRTSKAAFIAAEMGNVFWARGQDYLTKWLHQRLVLNRLRQQRSSNDTVMPPRNSKLLSGSSPIRSVSSPAEEELSAEEIAKLSLEQRIMPPVGQYRGPSGHNYGSAKLLVVLPLFLGGLALYHFFTVGYAITYAAVLLLAPVIRRLTRSIRAKTERDWGEMEEAQAWYILLKEAERSSAEQPGIPSTPTSSPVVNADDRGFTVKIPSAIAPISADKLSRIAELPVNLITGLASSPLGTSSCNASPEGYSARLLRGLFAALAESQPRWSGGFFSEESPSVAEEPTEVIPASDIEVISSEPLQHPGRVIEIRGKEIIFDSEWEPPVALLTRALTNIFFVVDVPEVGTNMFAFGWFVGAQGKPLTLEEARIVKVGDEIILPYDRSENDRIRVKKVIPVYGSSPVTAQKPAAQDTSSPAEQIRRDFIVTSALAADGVVSSPAACLRQGVEVLRPAAFNDLTTRGVEASSPDGEASEIPAAESLRASLPAVIVPQRASDPVARYNRLTGELGPRSTAKPASSPANILEQQSRRYHAVLTAQRIQKETAALQNVIASGLHMHTREAMAFQLAICNGNLAEIVRTAADLKRAVPSLTSRIERIVAAKITSSPLVLELIGMAAAYALFRYFNRTGYRLIKEWGEWFSEDDEEDAQAPAPKSDRLDGASSSEDSEAEAGLPKFHGVTANEGVEKDKPASSPVVNADYRRFTAEKIQPANSRIIADDSACSMKLEAWSTKEASSPASSLPLTITKEQSLDAAELVNANQYTDEQIIQNIKQNRLDFNREELEELLAAWEKGDDLLIQRAQPRLKATQLLAYHNMWVEFQKENPEIKPMFDLSNQKAQTRHVTPDEGYQWHIRVKGGKTKGHIDELLEKTINSTAGIRALIALLSFSDPNYMYNDHMFAVMVDAETEYIKEGQHKVIVKQIEEIEEKLKKKGLTLNDYCRQIRRKMGKKKIEIIEKIYGMPLEKLIPFLKDNPVKLVGGEVRVHTPQSIETEARMLAAKGITVITMENYTDSVSIYAWSFLTYILSATGFTHITSSHSANITWGRKIGDWKGGQLVPDAYELYRQIVIRNVDRLFEGGYTYTLAAANDPNIRKALDYEDIAALYTSMYRFSAEQIKMINKATQKGHKIILNCLNGSAWKTLEPILRRLKIDPSVFIPIFQEEDRFFNVGYIPVRSEKTQEVVVEHLGEDTTMVKVAR
ncbi:MAG: hypothetical protein ACOY3D_06480, partial [Candidatus Omnitrophota bacterium]